MTGRTQVIEFADFWTIKPNGAPALIHPIAS
jgi:hypothetical protein